MFYSFLVFIGFSFNTISEAKPVTKGLSRDGISYIQKDSLYSVNFRFRMQNRAAMLTKSKEDLSTSEWEFRVRRLRLRMDGFAFHPKLNYYIQLSFSRADMDWNDADQSKINTSPTPVRDAMIFYRPNKKLSLGFGQGKLPGNRQRVISSGELQFTDRSIANNTFTLDRDFGFFGTYENTIGKNKRFTYILKSALTSGEGRMNIISKNPGLCFTERIEILPFGKFSNRGDYFEGDVERESTPKLSIGGGFGYNQASMRSGGQLGRDLALPFDMLTWIADFVFKYHGWALSGEYLNRTSRNQPTLLKNFSGTYIYCGQGFNSQLSYCFPSSWEFAGRVAMITPFESVENLAQEETHYTLGTTRYLNHHRVKAQANISLLERKHLVTKTNSEQVYIAFQVELGI